MEASGPSAALVAAASTQQSLALPSGLSAVHPAVCRRSACPHNHPGTGHDDTEVGEADLLEAYACLFDSFVRNQQVCPTQQPVHLCDTACPLLNHRNLYMCCCSGHVHLCTPMACDRAVEHDSGRSCEVTGVCYDLDFRVTFEMGERSAHYRRSTRCVSARPSSSRAGRAGDGLSVAATTPAASMLPPVNRRLYNQLHVLPELEQMEIRSLVRKLLPTLGDARRAELECEVHQTYIRVKRAPPFLEHSNGHYTLAMHTALALFAMAQSGVGSSNAFIRPHADVRAALPSVDACAQLLGASFRSQYKSKMKSLSLYAFHC
jgi:hypothetical protein